MPCSPPTYLFILVTGVLLVLAHSQTSLDEDFVSIDCGLHSGSSYVDEKMNITYISDDQYIDTGENHNISSQHQGAEQFRSGLNLRSFPTGGRNCYTLYPAIKGQKYLIRGMFMHGNYDNKGQNLVSSPVIFDIRIGLNFWNRLNITNATMTYTSEAIVVAIVNSVSVCLVDNGEGTPFISSLEMRPMKSSNYPAATPNHPLLLQDRRSMGASRIIRYPDDPYDRIWWLPQSTSGLIKISTRSLISRYTDDVYEVPVAVLKTAATTSSTSTALNFLWAAPTGWDAAPGYLIGLHFTDFQQDQLREFDIYYNKDLWNVNNEKTKPPYLLANYINGSTPYTSDNALYNISLVATNASVLPPMLNAIEIYYQVQQDEKMTSSEDVEAMMTIKIDYQVKKNWMGDPCLPEKYTWSGLKCRRQVVTSRIISLDLSSSDLQGAISEQFSMLRSLEYLNLSNNDLTGSVPESLTNLPNILVIDLSGNQLNGTFPEALCKNRALTLRYDKANGDPCIPGSSKKKNKAVLAVAVVVPVVIVVILISAMLMLISCKKHAIVKSRDQEQCGDHIHIPDNQEFTYEELVKITNNFSAFIGEGGFGPVFHGQLKDGTQLAVKMRSPTSMSGKGMPEFLAEVESLTTVHHRYLVLLVGYCSDQDHLALVYEYMPNGSLYDHLRGKNAIVQRLSWQHRAKIALEAAQGLDYLHTGCVLPIVHRDVKSHNILLGCDLTAKISDFGLSKSYMNVAQSHITATAAGTLGYIDPEYCLSGRLTISSDVFSFGVVLLEIVTGEPPIIPTNGHIVQRIKEKVNMGNIEAIADPRLHGEFDISSIWKVVDIALLCTKEASSERPTMSMVVAQLKDALALEQARLSYSISDISQGGANAELSINSMPTAR
uniref:non-specific serine/threonine protein kinase n=1 Tax=Oryza punctata TaxID=4537 RepID=A0A0E0M0A3_ORYPU